MKKIVLSIATATMLLGGLTACGTDNQESGMGANYRSTGYDSQDMRSDNRYRGEGPLTDMVTPDDRRGTFNRQDNRTRVTNYSTHRVQRDGSRANQRTPGMGRTGIVGDQRPGMVDDDGLLRGRTRDGYQRAQMQNQHRNGVMKHGTRANNIDGHKSHKRHQRAQNSQHIMNYHEDYDSRTAQNIANRVVRMNGVEDCRVIVHDDDVVVGVETNGNAARIEDKVERTVHGLADGKNVHVVTDTDIVGRIRTMDDQLRTGTAFDEVTDTFTDMLGDLGRAVQRPFENAR